MGAKDIVDAVIIHDVFCAMNQSEKRTLSKLKGVGDEESFRGKLGENAYISGNC